MLKLDRFSGDLFWNNKVVSRLKTSEILVLSLLIENKGRLLSKDELLDFGWPGKVVAPNSLNVVIKNLRKILSLTDGAAYIETAHTKGYAFHSKNISCVVIDTSLKTADYQCEAATENIFYDKNDYLNSTISDDNSVTTKEAVQIITEEKVNASSQRTNINKNPSKVANFLLLILFIFFIFSSSFVFLSKKNTICYFIGVQQVKICGVVPLKKNQLDEIIEQVGNENGEFIYGYEKGISNVTIFKVN
ncbi:winged helix-turn-helix domain-containing protein [Aeromonas hydrophila]|uniref:winged helix-turn-helix domain-containing protein n=1 Tax=Aeromonas hydrophila TaxID=644 RepID=UPI00191F849A|nr:helix-turn-helix domain-containing protein [Aeromonas hydrophila]MBL0560965.1 helix-turn-helix domain-containing protein [Aeromonas hydrophila]